MRISNRSVLGVDRMYSVLSGTRFRAHESPLVSRQRSAKSALAQKTSRTALVRCELGSSREGVERAVASSAFLAAGFYPTTRPVRPNPQLRCRLLEPWDKTRVRMG